MKTKRSPLLFLLLLALWSVICLGTYFFAVAIGFEPILPIYLVLAFLSAFLYLLLQSPVVEIQGKEEANRKRKAWIVMPPKTHRRLCQGVLGFSLPFILAFLADYLLILLDESGLFDGLL